MADTSLKIVFAGTPDFAAIHLQGILERQEHEVIAVYSQPDRPAGRGKKLKPSPVKQLALDHQIPVYQPLNFKQEADQEALAELQAEIDSHAAPADADWIAADDEKEEPEKKEKKERVLAPQFFGDQVVKPGCIRSGDKAIIDEEKRCSGQRRNTARQ